MVWGMSFWLRVRQSSILGALVAIVFVVALCVLGLVGIAHVDGFHLAGG
ncbi:archaellin/type IV pilin N-terminal domain-containing protein [Bombella apis]|nr:archaellin/type IV pilin N-terminal domain-containing protein [Bombella apis]